MFGSILTCNCVNSTLKFVRGMTTTEIAAALRPFYLFVHPDLFGKHPQQQVANEDSLKKLHSFIESIHLNKPVDPCKLTFYIRNKNDNVTGGGFNLVKIQLNDKDVKATILNILKACNLPTEYIETAIKSSTPNRFLNRNDIFTNEPNEEDFIVEDENERGEIQEYTLKAWLAENHTTSLQLWKEQTPVREQMLELQKRLSIDWEVKEIKWETGWNEQHFRGCLRSLQALAEQHPDLITYLKDRILVFGSFTGVSLDGHIFLNSGEVQHNWLDVIRRIPSYDLVMRRIPAFEKTVSQVLNEIKVVRRKFMPKIIAGEYEKQLLKLTTAMSDHWGRNSYPRNWPKSLANYEIVVESESGPLMVSPTGQFIVPSSCPPSLLVPFITEKLDEASLSMDKYKKNKHVERFLKTQCIETLQLLSLTKSDNVSPDNMIDCCERLLKNEHQLHQLKGINLNISTYYSVLNNGVVCIPWNWNL